MLELEFTNQFKRDLRLAKRRGRSTSKLDTIVEKLLKEIPLDPKNRDHTLFGDYKDHQECHIEPDWLLIYLKSEIKIILVRTGTHSDLF
jgi:mRNA interferase YafQ